MENTKKHFHTFDALRFFSFFVVFLHHLPIDESSFFHFFSKSGGVGVSFFFVLSGFLITYILMKEKHLNGNISLKNFLIRRILRIWPLFYTMLLFAFLTPYILKLFQLSYSDAGYAPNWLMSVLFLENYQMMITDSVPNVSPLWVMWSLCIEEHFYLVWGFVFFVIPIKKTPYLILISIFIANISRIIYSQFHLGTFDLLTNVDYFAYGAIPAYLLVIRNDIWSKIEMIPMYVRYGLLFLTLSWVFVLPNFQNEYLDLFAPTLYGLMFASVILFTLTHRNSIQIPDRFLMSKLGKYTYGLYLFHTIIINFLIHIKPVLPFEIDMITFAFIALLSTILVSMLSYHLFEKQFLKLKKYFY
jgi:peptidoglycan/LPS O-acetylase OafA/YrhL